MSEHVPHGPIAPWDRGRPYGTLPGFGFVEMDDDPAPQHPPIEARPGVEAGRHQFPPAYSDPDQYDIRRDTSGERPPEPHAIEPEQQGEQL